MTGPASQQSASDSTGLLYGLLGVAGFSLTLPATRLAVAHLDPFVVSLGRALVAAVCAALLLLVTRQPWPTRTEIKSLLLVASGVVFGFPLLSTWATQRVPAAHGAVVLGLMPLATACVAALRIGERPSRTFWLASIAGSATVIGFALSNGAGQIEPADLALFGAVLAAAVGYAEGGKLARTLGGWQVISWALVIAAPLVALGLLLTLRTTTPSGPLSAWLGFGYVSLVSQFLAFFAWYRGLALGGVARISQLQLLQPFLTLLASALLLSEHISLLMLASASLVVLTVAIGRKAAVARR